MKPNKKLMMALFVAFFISTISHAKGIDFQHLTLKQGIEKAKKENKQLFIDVYATWCGPCKYLTSSVFTDSDLGKFMNENFICLKLDGEKDDGMSLMMDYNLDSYPTMLFLSPEKVMLKKLVGVASPDEINSAGSAVLDPESTDLFKLQKRYNEGENEKAFMHSLIEELLVNDQDTEALIDVFLKLYPDLDLQDESDFLVFCLAIDDLENGSMQEFIADAGTFRELHGDLVETKMTMILIGFIEEAVEKEDPQIINKGVDKVFDAYSAVFGEDGYEKEALMELLLESYSEETE